jgi:hypothetical protein
MSVYKEGYYVVDIISKASKQIYLDACDFGAPANKGDNIWNWAKQLVDWYGVEGTRKSINYGTGKIVESIVKLMNEGNGRYDEFKITYTTTYNKKYDGYFTIEKYTNN